MIRIFIIALLIMILYFCWFSKDSYYDGAVFDFTEPSRPFNVNGYPGMYYENGAPFSCGFGQGFIGWRDDELNRAMILNRQYN